MRSLYSWMPSTVNPNPKVWNLRSLYSDYRAKKEGNFDKFYFVIPWA